MSDRLIQTPTQGVPKSVDDIVRFIVGLQDKNLAKIFAAQRRQLENCIKLVPSKNISDKQPYIVVSGKDTARNKYHVFCETKSEPPPDKNGYSTSRHALIEKLSDDLHAQSIVFAYNGKLMIPSDKVLVRVRISYSELWKSVPFDHKVGSVGEMNIEHVPLGLRHIDDVLGSICAFARGEVKS